MREFLITAVTATSEGYPRQLKSILGELQLTSEQATRLGLTPRSQISPYLEACCLRASATVSYARAEQDIVVSTGMRVSAKTQQR